MTTSLGCWRSQRATSRMTLSSKCHLISVIALVLLVCHATVDLCWARYLPMKYPGFGSPARRQDSGGANDDYDDETLDSNASSPYYQNQDDVGPNGEAAAASSDGYDDPEPDGPYEETPKDQEGQADLERFFDDHLGASERDGMDKENLPTNLVIQLLEPPSPQTPTTTTTSTNTALPGHKQTSIPFEQSSQTVQTRFFRLPDQRMLITRQITHDTTTDGNEHKGAHHRPPRTEVEMQILMSNQQQTRPPEAYRQQSTGDWNSRDGLDAKGSHIVTTEDEDDDRVYITNATNRPFRIDALGGYDPEEDFIDASRDIEGGSSAGPNGAQDGRGSSRSASRGSSSYARRGSTDEQQPQAARDISFNEDPEGETLFEDASETDEITFGQDDPHDTDLEAEMRRQAFDVVGRFNADGSARPPSQSKHESSSGQATDRDGNTVVDVAISAGQSPESSPASSEGGPEIQQPEASTGGPKRARKSRPSSDYEDDEGNWVNDGVEDMDIPSQSHQDEVLEKAAKQEEAKRRADEEAEEQAAEQQQPKESNNDETSPTEEAGDSENQRMPNADYLKSDLRGFDDSAYKRAAAR